LEKRKNKKLVKMVDIFSKEDFSKEKEKRDSFWFRVDSCPEILKN